MNIKRDVLSSLLYIIFFLFSVSAYADDAADQAALQAAIAGNAAEINITADITTADAANLGDITADTAVQGDAPARSITFGAGDDNKLDFRGGSGILQNLNLFGGNPSAARDRGGLINLLNASAILNIKNNVLFSFGYATWGGAIHQENGSTLNIDADGGGNISFISNRSASGGAYGGGAILVDGSTANITALAGSSVLFNNNTATQGKGGAIGLFDAPALLNVKAEGAGALVSFTGNSAAERGGAIYNNDTGGVINITASNGGKVVFDGNTDNTSNAAVSYGGGAISSQRGAINITADGARVEFTNNTSTGSSKTAGALFVHAPADDESLDALVLSTTNNGSIYFDGNTGSGAANDIMIWEGHVRVNGDSGYVRLNGGIASAGENYDNFINKDGGNTLIFAGDNSGFFGSTYGGDIAFLQTGGVTKFTADATMFNDFTAKQYMQIQGGEMQFVLGDGSAANVSKARGTFSGTGNLAFLAGTETEVTAAFNNPANVDFAAADTTDIIFGADYNEDTSVKVNANYRLNADADFAKTNLGRVVFRDSTLKVNNTSYTANQYSLDNTTLDLRDAAASAVTFDDLQTLNGSKLSFDAAFDSSLPGGLAADSLTVTAGGTTIGLGDIALDAASAATDDGKKIVRSAAILNGLTFATLPSAYTLYSPLYAYSVSVTNNTDGADMTLTATGFKDGYSLNAQNTLSGDRDFNFGVYGPSGDIEDYVVADGLDAMAAGDLNVLGRNDNAADSVIDADGNSLFDVSAGANLTLSDITVKNAQNSANGGAVNNTDGVVNILNATFTDNGATGLGGAIYNDEDGTVNIYGGTAFSGANTAAQGNAIYNKGELNLDSTGGDITFDAGNDIAADGGEINVLGPGDVNIGGGISGTGDITKSEDGRLLLTGDAGASAFTGTFTNEAGETIANTDFFGGLVNITGGSVELADGASAANTTFSIGEDGVLDLSLDTPNLTLGTITANNGTSGAIDKTGAAEVTFAADESGFAGEYNQSAGTSVFTDNTFAGQHNISEDAVMEMAGGSAFAGGASVDLTDSAKLLLSSDNDLTLPANITGESTSFIDKTGAGNLNITADAGDFAGAYTQEAGNSVFTAETFGGAHNINGGYMEMADGSAFADGAAIALTRPGQLNITADTTALTLADNVLSGDGATDKTGAGVLNITGDNSAYTGAFTQSAGSTLVTSGGKMFGGDNSVSASTLEVTGGSIYYGVTLGDGGVLKHHQDSGADAAIPSGIEFGAGAAGAAIYFDADPALSTPASYVLNDKIDNGLSNDVYFTDSRVALARNDYTGQTRYHLDNSALDITTPADSVREVDFTTLTAGNGSLISFGLTSAVDPSNTLRVTSDTLNTAAGSSGTLGLGVIKVIDNKDNGLFNNAAVTLLTGAGAGAAGLHLDPASTAVFATTAYEYKAVVDAAQTGVDLTAVKASSDNSLYDMNALTGVRGFNFGFYEDTPTYYNIAQSLSATEAGNFTVQGYDDDAADSVLSGLLTGGGGTKGAFFNLVNATDFELLNMTVQDARATGGGSVLAMSNDGATALLDNLIITANAAGGDGGAINKSGAGVLTISDTSFTSNQADGKGGAVYNSGSLTLDSTGGDVIFASNIMDADGTPTPNDIYNDAGGVIEINGTSGRVEINSGVAGGGAINKSGAGSLLVKAGYSGGLTTITGGAVEFAAGSSMSSSAKFNIGSGGKLLFSSNDAFSLAQGQMSGYLGSGGTIEQTGTGTLSVTGDNSAFNGAYDQKAGEILFTSATFGGLHKISNVMTMADDSSFADNATIELTQPGRLEITADTALTLAADVLSGNGATDKTGAGVLNITGDNSAYTGAFTQSAGSTVVTSGGKMFGGDNNISGSVLTVNSDYGTYYTANLGDNAVLNHYNTDNAPVSDIQGVSFTGAGANANFGAESNAYYNLNAAIDNGSANSVSFENSIVSLGANDYTGATVYNFKNSTLDITDPDIFSTSTRNVSFTTLNTENTSLNFTLLLSGNTLTSDTLTAAGSGALNLGVFRILSDPSSGDNGLNETRHTTILSGGLQFNPASKSRVITGIYEYEADVDAAGTGVDLSVVKEADEYSLDVANTYDGNSSFNLTYFDSSYAEYNIGASLSDATNGDLLVSGNSADLSVLSGALADGSGNGSFFKLVDTTDLTLENITVRDAQTAGNGAALNISGANSTATLDGVAVSGNTSAHGGALYLAEGVTEVLGGTSFSGNEAAAPDGQGGAVYNAARLDLNASAGDITFSGNSAAQGADIYNDGVININGADASYKVSLEGGVAGTNAGEINKSGEGALEISGDSSGYLGTFNQTGGTTVATAGFFGGESVISAGTLELAQNSVVAGSASIELGSAGVLEISSSGDHLISALSSTGSGNGFLNKTGSGALTLADASAFSGDMRLSGGSTALSGPQSLSLDSFHLAQGAGFDMRSVQPNPRLRAVVPPTVLSVTDFTQAGDLYMNANANDGTHDQVIASGADNTITPSNIFVTMVDPVKLSSGVTISDLFLGAFSGDLSGFSVANITNRSLLGNVGAQLLSTGTGIDLLLYLRSLAHFGGLGGLSHNQLETADALDAILNGAASDDFHQITDAMDTLSEAGQAAALSQLHGGFLANAIMSASFDESRKTLYGRLAPAREGECHSCAAAPAAWAQASGLGVTLKSDGNSPEDFKASGWGTQAGLDLFGGDSFAGGLYLSYMDNNLTQGDNKADIQSYEAGLYAGWFGERWDVKASLAGGTQNFDTTRNITFAGRTAKADFNTYSAGADITAGYKIRAGDINFKPFVGARGGLVSNGSFSEEGAGAVSLSVESGNYFHGGVSGGLGFEGQTGGLRWYADAHANFLAAGRENKIKTSFAENKDVSMDIYSVKQDALTYGAALGAEVDLWKNLSLYANAAGDLGGGYNGYRGNLGVNYRFSCGKKGTCDTTPPAPAQAAAAPQPAPAAAPAPAEQPVVKKGATLKIGNSYFTTGSALMGPKLREYLDIQARELATMDYDKVTITGYTDNTGSAQGNQLLSERRAQAVAGYLAMRGVPRAKLEHNGMGELNPVATNSTTRGRALNRRVEIKVE